MRQGEYSLPGMMPHKGDSFIRGAQNKVPISQVVPSHFLSGFEVMTWQALAKWPRNAGIKQNLQATGSSIRLRAYSKTAIACSRVAEGNASSHSSMLTPSSRFSKRLLTGSRVP